MFRSASTNSGRWEDQLRYQASKFHFPDLHSLTGRLSMRADRLNLKGVPISASLNATRIELISLLLFSLSRFMVASKVMFDWATSTPSSNRFLTPPTVR